MVWGFKINTGGKAGEASFKARVSSATNGGNIEIRLESITGTLIGTCPVAGTGGWQAFTDVNCAVSGGGGKHDLYLKFTGENTKLADLDANGEINALDFSLLKQY